jgi:ParB family chromosome partitioning protein
VTNKGRGTKSIIASFGTHATTAAENAEVDSYKAPAIPVTRVGAGVVGATQRSLTEIREERDRLRAAVEAGGILDIDPDHIRPSPFLDRLPDDDESELKALMTLIREEGQKVPIQVRKVQGPSEQYQIVYGHRRWQAALRLNIKVKAIVVEMTDQELVIAQGIENSARQDLSWIERALFAWHMDQAGIRAREIRAALSIDDPELARMRSVCRSLPVEVIKGIGRAPKVGRPRWVELAAIVSQQTGAVEKIHETLSADKGGSSDERFMKVLKALKAPVVKEPAGMEFLSPAGQLVGRAVFSDTDIKITVDKTQAPAFISFLQQELPSLVQKYFSAELGERNAS